MSEGTFVAYFKLKFIGTKLDNCKTNRIGLKSDENNSGSSDGGFVVSTDTGRVYLNRDFIGKLYEMKEELKVADIICAKGNLETNEFSLSLIRNGCKYD